MLKRIKQNFFIAFSFLLALSLLTTEVFATAPSQSLGFHGQLLSDGSAVSGTKSITFQFYDALSGGSTEGSLISKSVTVTNGYFSTTFDSSDLSGINLNQSLWVAVTVEGDPLSPRLPLNAVPASLNTFGVYAYSSAPTVGTAGSLYYNTGDSKTYVSNGVAWAELGTQWVTTGSDIYYTTGNVGIGTTSPYSKLSVAGQVVASNFVATSTATSSFAGPVTLASHCITVDTKFRRRKKKGEESEEDEETDLASLEAGDYIESFDEETQTVVYKKIESIFVMGIKSIIQIDTTRGYSIKTTEEHPYYVKNSQDQKGSWVKVKDLNLGNNIAVIDIKERTVSFDSISAITNLPEEEVFDLEIEGTHTFIANNIVAHNTYVTGGLGVGVLNTSAGTFALKQSGTNAVILGDVSGDARGSFAIDIQSGRAATKVASGGHSIVVGFCSSASGSYSTALGAFANATNIYSNALGFGNTASGIYSSASGYSNTASGGRSSALGYHNTASGYGSISSGYLSTASGNFSSALGFCNTASAYGSTASGYCSVASGVRSTAFGYGNTSSSLNSQLFGRSNFTGTGLASVGIGILNNQIGGTLTVATGVITGTPVATNAGCGSTAVGICNTASSTFSSAFGFDNLASAYGTIASGFCNTASQGASSASGYCNVASGSGSVSFGFKNTASVYSSSAIGNQNTASGYWSSAIGYLNTASGYYSSAIGYINNASASKASAIGYSNTASSGYSTAVGMFNTASGCKSSSSGYYNIASGCLSATFGSCLTNAVDASTMVGIASGWLRILATGQVNSSSGACLTAGGTWTNASDRNLKENFVELDKEEVLTKINSLPLTKWNYKSEDSSVMHIGPMAQDFYGIFGLGDSDKAISTIDPAGIALVGVQALSQKLDGLDDTTGFNTETGEVDTETFFGKFVTKLSSWFANAKNGIGDFFANKIRTKELCLEDSAGDETCITKDDLDSLLHNTVQNGNSDESVVSSDDTTNNSNTENTVEEETIVPPENPVEVAPEESNVEEGVITSPDDSVEVAPEESVTTEDATSDTESEEATPPSETPDQNLTE